MGKGHHYLPQFYLRYFEDPDSRMRGLRSPYLWIYKKGEVGPSARGVKNVAAKKKYHSFYDEKGRENQTAERTFTLIENDAAYPFRKIANSTFDLDKDEKSKLSLFLSSIFVRAPLFRTRIQKLEEGFLHTIYEELSACKSVDQISPEIRRILPNVKEMTEDDLVKFKSIWQTEHFSFQSPFERTLYYMFSSFKRFGFEFWRKRWSFAISVDGARFITSDTPIVTRLGDFDGVPATGGIGFDDAIITFPVSPYIALVMSNVIEKQIIEVRKPFVRAMNKKTIQYAQIIVSAKKISSQERKAIGIMYDDGLLTWGDSQIIDLWEILLESLNE